MEYASTFKQNILRMWQIYYCSVLFVCCFNTVQYYLIVVSVLFDNIWLL